ncbi:hypothetical protein BDP27DRAFT_1334209 [Rhodocollybia butyracea]|uniref:Uncharacterized protein n=1 Tax=Rhodocollybia butyracea TaxID=206335 RepID=A0A9P5U2K2_9AGAR|nr:hypothetical protein BDP27DRAFT_1334209 [Rhodocollybia butyracea]
MSSHLVEMDAISHVAKDIYWRLSRLNPPGEDASPTTKNAFMTMLTTVAQAAGQTLDKAVGLSYLVTNGEGDPPNLGLTAREWHDLGQEPQSDEEDVKLDEEKTIQVDGSLQPDFENELERVFEKTEEVSSRYTLDNFLKMVLHGGHSGRVAEEEREAYHRMMIGYRHYSRLEISAYFEKYNVAYSSVSFITTDVLEIAEITDPFTRLRRRETLIFRGPSEDAVASYLLAAYDDWMNLSYDSRQEFITSFARSLLPQDFNCLDSLNIPQKEKKKRYTALIKPTRTKHCKMMEQRKRFQDLYFRFGPIVLVDPTFMKMGTKQYPRMCPSTLAVFKEVIKHVDGPDPAKMRYNEDRRFVTQVLRVLGGSNISNYVSNFLMEKCFWAWDEESEEEEE